MNIPEELIIEASTLQNKDKLMEALGRQAEQVQQAQQAQLQAALAEQQARTNLANARAVADQGLGVERMSRIQENQALAVERKAQAERDHFAAVLDFVKAVKELEGIDINNLERLITLARIVSQEETNVESVRDTAINPIRQMGGGPAESGPLPTAPLPQGPSAEGMSGSVM